jgi:hypothetical protein
MLIERPRRAVAQRLRSGHVMQWAAKLALPAPRRDSVMVTVTSAGQVTLLSSRSIRNWSLVNRPPRLRVGGTLALIT